MRERMKPKHWNGHPTLSVALLPSPSPPYWQPPKMKESDSEKRYVQRPVGEQHRPPPMKHAGPKPKERDEY